MALSEKFRPGRRGVLFIVVTPISATILFIVLSYLNFFNPKDLGAIKVEDNPFRAPVEIEKYDIVKYKVEAGDTWENIMKKLDLSWELGLKVYESSKSAHNLASLSIGNEFRFIFSQDGARLKVLEYDIDDEKILRIEGGEGFEFSAKEEPILYDIKLVTKRGVIEKSLFETAQEEEIPPAVILDMAWIFSWDIDFASSVQPSDSFSVLYEERYRDGQLAKPGKVLAVKFTNSGKDFYAVYYKNPEGRGSYYNQDGRELRRQFLRSPLDYKRITSGFSYSRFHPILNTFTTHRAIDYAADTGTPVSATAHGTVTYVGWKGGNGNFIEVKHANGYSSGYAHLSAYAKGIKIGAKVTQNQVIGFVGSTGLSTGPHLHYEMRKNGTLINPLSLDLPPGDIMKEEYREEFLRERESLLKLLGVIE